MSAPAIARSEGEFVGSAIVDALVTDVDAYLDEAAQSASKWPRPELTLAQRALKVDGVVLAALQACCTIEGEQVTEYDAVNHREYVGSASQKRCVGGHMAVTATVVRQDGETTLREIQIDAETNRFLGEDAIATAGKLALANEQIGNVWLRDYPQAV